jgi:hypothetical protein
MVCRELKLMVCGESNQTVSSDGWLAVPNGVAGRVGVLKPGRIGVSRKIMTRNRRAA